jgi:hypothetical protein
MLKKMLMNLMMISQEFVQEIQIDIINIQSYKLQHLQVISNHYLQAFLDLPGSSALCRSMFDAVSDNDDDTPPVPKRQRRIKFSEAVVDNELPATAKLLRTTALQPHITVIFVFKKIYQ